jgi:hypothetical protein
MSPDHGVIWIGHQLPILQMFLSCVYGETVSYKSSRINRQWQNLHSSETKMQGFHDDLFFSIRHQLH